MPGIFSRIVAGEIPCYKIAEDKDYFAFLDISPLALGHTLVIPKQETDYIFTLDDELYQGLFLFAKKIAQAIEKVVVCKRIGIAVIGLEVPHAHIHLVPMNHLHDIDFKKPKLKLSQQEFEEITAKIQAALSL
jgi:histidine triad (HIT) family protein